MLDEGVAIEEEYNRIVNVIADDFVGKPLTIMVIESLKLACNRIEHHLNSKFYPKKFEVFVFVNEEERKVKMGYREMVTGVVIEGFPDVTPLLKGFRRVI